MPEPSRHVAGAPPPGVAQRLAELRARYVPEKDKAARERLGAETGQRSKETFATGVARRLEELSALCDLAKHLGRR
jgi:hypothetical protein